MARFSGSSGGGEGDVGPAGPAGSNGADGADGIDGKDSLFLGTWDSVTAFLAVYQGGPVGLADGDWWAFVKDNTNPNKIYVVREDPNSATGWVIDDNEHFVLPAGADGADGNDGAPGADGSQGPQGDPGPLPFNYLGEFDYGVTYAGNDAVTFQGGLWKLNNTIGAAGYTPTPGQWTLIIPAGTAGADGTNGNDGAPGADGNDGAQGPQGDPGSPGLVYLGNYVSGNGYIANLAVVKGSDNNLYIATSSGGLGDPVGNSAEWGIFLPKGADGANGQDGAPGENGADGADGGFGASASYHSRVDQGPQVSANLVQPFTFSTTDWETGIQRVDNTKIKMLSAGKYNIAFSAQLYQTSNTGTVNIWLNKNGSPMAYTNTKVVVESNAPYKVAAWNFFVDAAVDDYYEIMWSSSSTNTKIEYDAAQTINGNLHPEIPSIIVTVNQVG